ncbi:MAG: hypothetical protein K9I94_08990 [Bacteroidales bacterium]|nr:hypothetical protein [Bacteroidales bacterium]
MNKTSFYDEVLAFDRKNGKLNTHDWLSNIPDTSGESGIVEVRFKNTRKLFCENTKGLSLSRGDVVTVEAYPGHDIGIVSLTGRLAGKQFGLKVKSKDSYVFRKIYRKSNPSDITTWKQAKDREEKVKLKTRQIIKEQGLEMKLSDVEFQGDNTKAIFYYTADGRVDFRKLIKLISDEFNIRVEMKQIGSRQESGLIGGIGSCGRELCCSTWRTDFDSVTLEASKIQDLPPNAQRLAGQCGKLKCCLLYELENYIESWEEFPKVLLELETANGKIYPHKRDILHKRIWYSYSKQSMDNPVVLTLDEVREFIDQNKRGKKPAIEREEKIDGSY